MGIRRQLFPAAKVIPVTIDGTLYVKAAGTGTYVSGPIDTQGYDSVAVITNLGTVTATSVVTQTIQDSKDNAVLDAYTTLILPNTSTGTAGSGTNASQAYTSPTSNTCIGWDIYEPQKRYLTVTTVITVANTVINSMTIILFNAHQVPVTQTALAGTPIELNSPADATTV